MAITKNWHENKKKFFIEQNEDRICENFMFCQKCLHSKPHKTMMGCDNKCSNNDSMPFHSECIRIDALKGNKDE